MAVMVGVSGCATTDHVKRMWSDDMPVVGVVMNGQAKAYPVKTIESIGVIRDQVGARQITLIYDLALGGPRLFNEVGQALPVNEVSWGRWKAEHPMSARYEPSPGKPQKP